MARLRAGAEPVQRRGPHPLSLFLALATRHCAGDPARLARVLQGLRRYQEAPLLPVKPPAPTLHRRGSVRLRDVGGLEHGPLVVLVPSLINAPVVLDLAPGRSLVEHLVGQGFRVRMVDWGEPGKGEQRLGLAGLVALRLVPLLKALGEPFSLLGYCLGGTLSLAAATRLPDLTQRLALVATPWHFDGFAPEARANAESLWGAVKPVGQQLGAVPVSLLNPLFWSLDEEAVVRKFEELAGREADDPAVQWFASVEDWANSGAPLSLPAARDLFIHGFASDRIGKGRWKVMGARVSPAQIGCPVLDIGATRDRIVPMEARIRIERADVTRSSVDSGHVGMVVGSSARKGLWEPLSNWLRSS